MFHLFINLPMRNTILQIVCFSFAFAVIGLLPVPNHPTGGGSNPHHAHPHPHPPSHPLPPNNHQAVNVDEFNQLAHQSHYTMNTHQNHHPANMQNGHHHQHQQQIHNTLLQQPPPVGAYAVVAHTNGGAVYDGDIRR